MIALTRKCATSTNLNLLDVNQFTSSAVRGGAHNPGAVTHSHTLLEQKDRSNPLCLFCLQDMGTVILGKLESGSISKAQQLVMMPNRVNMVTKPNRVNS